MRSDGILVFLLVILAVGIFIALNALARLYRRVNNFESIIKCLEESVKIKTKNRFDL